MKQKIVFFGSGWYVVPAVKKLMEHGLDLVVTTEKDPNSPLLKFSSENNIKTLSCQTASDLINHKPSIINHQLAILASFGALIPDEIINLFPEGIINIHPSLLPKWKGPSPIQYSLLNGDTVTGVTLIKLDDQIDHGPILAQKPYDLSGNETTEDLLSILFEIGADMVVEQIEKLENGESLQTTPQDHGKETWSYKIEKKDGLIDPYNLHPTPYPQQGASSAYTLPNMIRAFHPWPGVWFRYNEIAASPSAPRNDDKSHVFATPDPIRGKQSSDDSRHPELVSGSSKLSGKLIKLLPENRIQVEGKLPMTYNDFVNGFDEEGKNLLKMLGLI